MGLAIRSAIQEGASEYDLLHGDESYKSHWAHARRELNRLILYPPHFRGVLYRQATHAGSAARRKAGWVIRRCSNWISAARQFRYGRA